jgi:aminomethyltransferase
MPSPGPAGQPKKTPLNARHRSAGARMVECAGWDMPVEYSGITEEHLAVRTRAGLFDVSHMGQIEVAGPDALDLVQWLTCNDASRLAVGQVQYSALMTAAGTFVDDLLVYRLGPDHYMFVVNAGNIVKDQQWVVAQAGSRGASAAVVNTSSRYALMAIQGPDAQAILQTLTDIDLAGTKSYGFATGEVAGVRATVSRTGYTGEDGFEVFVPPAQAQRVWDATVHAGQAADMRRCGLGARDTLRLEAAMRLCGADMDDQVTVLEAGLDGIVAWEKAEFLGAEVLRRQKGGELSRRLAAFEVRDDGIARPGYPVQREGRSVGEVTSGTRTPFLNKSIGLAMMPVDMTIVGTRFDVEVRGRAVPAEVVPEPFYKRPGRA